MQEEILNSVKAASTQVGEAIKEAFSGNETRTVVIVPVVVVFADAQFKVSVAKPSQEIDASK